MKKIIYALVVLVIVAVTTITLMFDSIGKKYAQEYASALLKTQVSISQFDSSFLDKNLNIGFVEVQNPSGFNNKNAFSLDHFSLKLGGDVFSDLIEIELLKFNGLKFVLEQNSGNVNLAQLLKNLESSSDSSSSTDSSSTSNKRVKIKRFVVENIELKVDTQFLKTTLEVPNISASNFGGNAGVGVDEIGRQITKEVLVKLQKALEKKGIEAGKKEIKETLIRKIGNKFSINGLKEKVNLDNIKDSVGSGYESVKDAVKKQFNGELKDKAKGLLKGFGF